MVDATGVTIRVRAELASYQLKHMGQVWFEKLRDERPLRDGFVDWGVFKEDFLDIFPLERREKKMVEFMNLRQGGMNVKEYSQIHQTLYVFPNHSN